MDFFNILTGTYYVFAILFICTFFYLLMEESKRGKEEEAEEDLALCKLEELEKKVDFVARRCGYTDDIESSDCKDTLNSTYNTFGKRRKK